VHSKRRREERAERARNSTKTAHIDGNGIERKERAHRSEATSRVHGSYDTVARHLWRNKREHNPEEVSVCLVTLTDRGGVQQPSTHSRHALT